MRRDLSLSETLGSDHGGVVCLKQQATRIHGKSLRPTLKQDNICLKRTEHSEN